MDGRSRGRAEGSRTVRPAVGNLYDKYNTRNPLARLLMRRFLRSVTELARFAAPQRVLEVGCGEGRLSQHLCERLNAQAFDACDLSLERLDPRHDPRIRFRTASVYDLPYPSAAFDLVVCCEVLEHLERPNHALSELGRVTGRWVLVSTPNEPLFRGLNLVRGAYLADFGNTPGHVQHFRRASLVRLVSTEFRVIRTRTPLPWVVVLAERRSPHLTARGEALR
jgi:ubiquinone/menaquinone biosynthesis C-methylase UbiE